MRASLAAHRRAGRLRALEIICLIVGVTALGWFVSARLAAARDQDNWARALEAQVAVRRSRPAVAPIAVGTRSGPAVSTTADGVIGRIDAPRLGISVITREGTDAATLERAVGHVANTALPGEPGNAAFAGHRDTFFRGLRHARAGDRITVTTQAAGTSTWSGRREWLRQLTCRCSIPHRTPHSRSSPAFPSVTSVPRPTASSSAPICWRTPRDKMCLSMTPRIANIAKIAKIANIGGLRATGKS